MKLTKVVDFAAAHSIPGAGKCENLHGHNWEATIEVELIEGDLNEQGFIADVRDIKQAAYKYDHDNLNNWFEVPSTENVAAAIANDVLYICLEANPNAELRVKVHLVETKHNSADVEARNYQ